MSDSEPTKLYWNWRDFRYPTDVAEFLDSLGPAVAQTTKLVYVSEEHMFVFYLSDEVRVTHK
jgi:hypothetical protein